MKKAILGLLALLSLSAQATEIKLGTANTILIRGVIDDASMGQAADKLLHLDKVRGEKGYPLYIVLDSPGGEIDSGETFIELAKTIKNVETITVFAASMASAIVEGLPGQRSVLDSGVLMFHRAKGSVSGQFETGEMESRLQFNKRYVRRMEQRNADRMGMKLQAYKKAVKDEMWLVSTDAVKASAADQVVSVSCTEALVNTKNRQTLNFFIFSIEVESSGCPLLKSVKPVEGQKEEIVNLFNRYKSEIMNQNKGALK